MNKLLTKISTWLLVWVELENQLLITIYVEANFHNKNNKSEVIDSKEI